ncbi:MAG: LamG-like jellyroll fold domain-containing protein [Candidatus Micrarchaeia archaeon]
MASGENARWNTVAIAALLMLILVLFSNSFAAPLSYSSIVFYENGADTSIVANNYMDTSYTPGPTRTTGSCSVGSHSTVNCFNAASHTGMLDQCQLGGTACEGGMLIDDFQFDGYFSSSDSYTGYLNIEVVMVSGTGTETTICQSPTGASGVIIPSNSVNSYNSLSIPCTPSSPVFVPAGYKLKVYINVYNSFTSSRNYRHRFNSNTYTSTLTADAARLGAINISLTSPASDISIIQGQNSTATCLVGGMASGQQAADAVATLVESYNGATYFTMAASGQNVTTATANPAASANLSSDTSYDFIAIGSSPSVNNYVACTLASTYNQSYNCSANACASGGLNLRSNSRRINVTAAINTSLAAWDSNDTQGGGQTIYPGNMAYFFANYTFQNGTPVSLGACNITYHDSSVSAMSYNATSKLFQSNRIYAAAGAFAYNVSCAFSSTSKSAAGSINIAALVLNLAIWDSTKPQGGSQQIAPGNTSYFFANFTSQLGAIAAGSCNISYDDNTGAAMAYNASSGLYYASRSYSLPGTYAYNVTCSYYSQSAFANSSLNVAPVQCNSPPRPKSDYPAGLVSYWPLDKNTSDAYGSNNAVAYGAALACGQVSGAFDYYTRADRIVAPASPSLYLPSSGTYELLVNRRSAIGWEGLMHKGQLSSFSDEDVSLQFNGANTLYVIFYDTSNNQYANTGPGTVPYGSWNHYVLSWNTTNSWVILNGALYLMSSKPGLVRDSGGALIIGAQINQSYNSLYQMLGIDGQVDEVAVYSSSMNLTTAQEHYNYTLAHFNYFPLRPNITLNGTALLGYATFIDPDGNALNYSYRWYRNDVEYSSGASTPYNFPQGVQMNVAVQPNISQGENWTLEVWATDGMAVSAPINSTPFTVNMPNPMNLATFTSTDPQGGNNTVYEGQQAVFYANATLVSNNSTVSGASCNITYHDNSTSPMYFNSSLGLYTANRSYGLTGIYSYNVSCAYGTTTVNATGSARISAVLFVSTSKPSYYSCATVFYKATTVTPLLAPVDTVLNISTLDPFSLQAGFETFPYGNHGTGIYYGSYNISETDPLGLWKAKAVTCGAIAQSSFNVN